MSEELLDQIQKSIYVALESADTATDAVKELARIRHDVIERAERSAAATSLAYRRALWVAAPMFVVGLLTLLVGSVMLFSTRHEFARIAEVSKEGLKAYLTDVNVLTKQLEGLSATRQQLEGLASAISAQQQEDSHAVEMQRTQAEALVKDSRAQHAAVMDALTRLANAPRPREPAARHAPAAQADGNHDAEIAAIIERLRVIQGLVERTRGPVAVREPRPDPRPDRILSALGELAREQKALAEHLRQARTEGLSYP